MGYDRLVWLINDMFQTQWQNEVDWTRKRSTLLSRLTDGSTHRLLLCLTVQHATTCSRVTPTLPPRRRSRSPHGQKLVGQCPQVFDSWIFLQPQNEPVFAFWCLVKLLMHVTIAFIQTKRCKVQMRHCETDKKCTASVWPRTAKRFLTNYEIIIHLMVLAQWFCSYWDGQANSNPQTSWQDCTWMRRRERLQRWKKGGKDKTLTARKRRIKWEEGKGNQSSSPHYSDF